jgi:hypothetical protein
MFAAVMALNAYSIALLNQYPALPLLLRSALDIVHTDLIQSALIREDGDMSVESCASYVPALLAIRGFGLMNPLPGDLPDMAPVNVLFVREVQSFSGIRWMI